MTDGSAGKKKNKRQLGQRKENKTKLVKKLMVVGILAEKVSVAFGSAIGQHHSSLYLMITCSGS